MPKRTPPFYKAARAHVRPQAQETKPVTHCPYCEGSAIIKKGARVKKYETVQLYYCLHCRKKFTPLANKHHTYPLKVIIEALNTYNRFNTQEATARIVSRTYGLPVSAQNVANWLNGFKDVLFFSKMRAAIAATTNRRNIFVQSRMFHRQIYFFKFHRAKLRHILKRHKSLERFRPLDTFLERVPDECPHRLFRENDKRSSSHKNTFILDEVKIVRHENAAIRMARFALQATPNNKLRHETLQEFMLLNDAVTVAVEVPITLTGRDIEYFQGKPGFQVPLDLKPKEIITGHIDFVQVRNDRVFILDYKPGAKKDKPIAQLTIYALALARLTGLRLYDFTCAWFDDKDYYEFYPLQVVHKRASGRAATVPFISGRQSKGGSRKPGERSEGPRHVKRRVFRQDYGRTGGRGGRRRYANPAGEGNAS